MGLEQPRKGSQMGKRILSGLGIALLLGAVVLSVVQAQGPNPPGVEREQVGDAAFAPTIECVNLSGYETVCRIKDDTGTTCYLYRGGYGTGSISCP